MCDVIFEKIIFFECIFYCLNKKKERDKGEEKKCKTRPENFYLLSDHRETSLRGDGETRVKFKKKTLRVRFFYLKKKKKSNVKM